MCRIQALLLFIFFLVGCFCQLSHAKENCSPVGLWTPSVFRNTFLVMLANGTAYGQLEGGPSIENSNSVCSFRGTYTLSPQDLYFTWHLQFVDCPFTNTEEHSTLFDGLFCRFDAPTYSYSTKFNAGCFATFDSTCTSVGFATYNGVDAGETTSGYSNVWTLSNTPVPTSKSMKETAPPVCALAGKKVTTLPGQQFLQKGFVNTTYEIHYHKNGSYKSHIRYIGTPSCQVAWEGIYSYGDRSDQFPTDTAYLYSASSNLSHPAKPKTPCEGYTADPALCSTYGSSTSHCLILWNDFQFGPSCTQLKIVGSSGSPTFVETADLPAEDLTDQESSASLLHCVCLMAVLVIYMLLV